jgi:cyclopropane fatty-acyl-phospholipid synthase-like methyltransferase
MKSPEELRQLHGKEYVEHFEKIHRSPLRLEKLLDLAPLADTDRVADFGCGNGLLMQHIAHRVKAYVGVDFSAPFVEAAERRKKLLGAENATFHCMTIEDFCIQNQGCFDAGFAFDFSEHVYDKEWVETLKSIRGSLKENGRLYLHTPNANFFMEILKRRDFIFKQLPGHIAVRTSDRNVVLLQEAGFSVTRVRLIPHYNLLRFIHPLSFIPIIGKFLQARIFIEAAK